MADVDADADTAVEPFDHRHDAGRVPAPVVELIFGAVRVDADTDVVVLDDAIEERKSLLGDRDGDDRRPGVTDVVELAAPIESENGRSAAEARARTSVPGYGRPPTAR